ncbi:ComEC/Rec2 family competence protein [Aliarcobacter butzleri]|uniref:ComEC/Rec2 family competence protein n=1 Tax=Aliarcobacter butzleri TaxID=28197 RepID=UPI002B23F739|nr:ComEC/Rec2 family competence protein [Aliarcobacter butzleri]
MFIKIIKSKKIVTIFILFFALLINILFEYGKYLEFIDEEVFETKVEVLNIYQKDDFDILKLKTSNFEFFTSIPKNQEIKEFDLLNILIVSRNIDFIDYLKGFYTKTIYFDELQKEQTFKDKIIKNIENNHQDEKIIELFNALFLAVPVSKELRDVITAYGIAHVVALSGFHLVVLSFVIYWILYFPYKFFQDRYFPYRNRKLDILLITIAILFYYLILTDIVPSLLRSFCDVLFRYLFT